MGSLPVDTARNNNMQPGTTLDESTSRIRDAIADSSKNAGNTKISLRVST